uniref:Uncharacterized protein n=1 Tax=Tanacetum cinerariifolium TaxID=118510 RepID=A0A6L2MMC8_TANCI|nr:hypothetical protein [Tanacetum cinerariifolium]
MGCLLRSACLESLSLTQSSNSLVLREGLEIWDNHICLRTIHGSKTVSDTVLKIDLCELVIKEVRTAITNDGTRGSKPSKERFQEFPNNSGVIDCEPIESGVKHLFGSLVRAMVSSGGSIMASLENVNGFLVVNTPLDDLICIDFKQEGVIPKENPSEQSRLGIFLVKEIFEGRVIRIHNAFVHDQDHTYGKVACIAHNSKGKSQSGAIKIGALANFFKCLKGFNTLFGEEEWGIFLRKTGHRPGCL